MQRGEPGGLRHKTNAIGPELALAAYGSERVEHERGTKQKATESGWQEAVPQARLSIRARL